MNKGAADGYNYIISRCKYCGQKVYAYVDSRASSKPDEWYHWDNSMSVCGGRKIKALQFKDYLKEIELL